MKGVQGRRDGFFRFKVFKMFLVLWSVFVKTIKIIII